MIKLVSIENLWPTKLGLYQLSDDARSDLAARLITTDADALQFIEQNQDIQALICGAMSDYALQKFNPTIVEAWTRKLDSGANHLELHVDSHYGGTHVMVMWLTGDADHGGDLVLYDPAWRNPQRPVDGRQDLANTKTVNFAPGRIAIFPADVWHSVTTYTGSARIGLNVIVALNPKDAHVALNAFMSEPIELGGKVQAGTSY